MSERPDSPSKPAVTPTPAPARHQPDRRADRRPQGSPADLGAQSRRRRAPDRAGRCRSAHPPSGEREPRTTAVDGDISLCHSVFREGGVRPPQVGGGPTPTEVIACVHRRTQTPLGGSNRSVAFCRRTPAGKTSKRPPCNGCIGSIPNGSTAYSTTAPRPRSRPPATHNHRPHLRPED